MDFVFILISILSITLLIVVHELGHYIAARYFGFQTPVFGIGMPFGPSIDLFNKWNTQFKFYFALIGGFVAIPELGDETDPELLKKYPIKLPLKEFPVYQRMIVASGGIIFNILFAFLIAVVMAGTTGLPKPVANTVVADFIKSNPTAKNAGLKIGDEIIKVNDTEINTGLVLQKTIKSLANQEILITVKRPISKEANLQKTKDIQYEEKQIKVQSPGSLGIVLANSKEYQHFAADPILWIIEAFKFISETLIAMFLSILGLLIALVYKILAIFNPQFAMDQVDLGQVKGIVGIVQIISHDIKTNINLLLEFTVLLSLNLAVINVLPIPALDGGHLAFMAYEAVVGKKPSEKLQVGLVQAGFVFLLSLIALTTLNDIKNWIAG